MLKRFTKWIGYFFLFLLLLFIVVWGLLQFPSIQTKIVHQVTNFLESTLGTKVSIDRINIKFFKTLSVEGIYLEDQQQDTLLYASSLDVNIGVFDLLGSEIFLNDVTLNEGFLNIYQNAGDTSLNINFLLEAFSADPTATIDTTTAASSWKFGLNTLTLNRTRIRYDDQVTGMKVHVNSNLLSIDLDALDLEEQSVDVKYISLEKNTFTVLSLPQNTVLSDTISEQTPLVFPYFDWDIVVDELEIKETSVGYQSGKEIQSKEGVNFKDIAITDLTVDFQDFVWKEEVLAVAVEEFSFLEKSGLQVDQLNGKLNFTPKKFSIDNFNLKTPYSNFNNNTTLTYPRLADLATLTEKVKLDLNFNNTKIGIKDIELLAPMIEAVSTININALQTIYLNGRVSGNSRLVNMVDTEIKVDQMLTLALNGRLKKPLNINELGFDIQLKEFASSYQELNKILKGVTLPTGLAEFGTFRLSGGAAGTLADFTTNDLKLATDLSTSFDLSGRIRNVQIPDQLLLDIKLEKLTTNVDEIGYLMPQGLPTNLRSLGTIAYTGEFIGGLTDFELIGDLTTDIGSLTSDLKANFNTDYSDATYQGDLALKTFQLNEILGDSLGVGEITFTGKVNGSGITSETIQAEIDANIDHIVYQKYDYQNLKIDGTIDRKKFSGDFKIEDPNISFDFTGLVDLNVAIPSFQFDMNIDTLNLQAINLLDQDLKFSGVLDFDFQATGINDLTGVASITDLAMSDSTQTYLADSIQLFSGLGEDGNNELSLTAPFLQGKINGDFDLEELPTMVLAYINDYFPLEDYLSPDQQQIKFADIEGRQNFEMRFNLIDITPLQILALPDLEYVETAILSGNFDSKNQVMLLSTELKKVVYGTNKFEQLNWKADGNNRRLTNNLIVENLEAGGNDFPEITLTNILRQDSAYFQLDVMGQDTIEKLVQLSAVVDRPEKAYEMRFDEQFILNDRTWKIPSDNLIRYDGQQILINNLALQDGVHQLIINSESPKNETVLIPDITIDFDQFQIHEISNLVIPGNDALGGTINGKIKVLEPTENLYFTVDLKIPDLNMNNEPVGAVTVDLSKSAVSSVVDVNVILKGAVNDLKIDGTYGIDAKQFDINAKVAALEMRLLDLLLVDVISDSKGTLNGNITVKGTPTKPDVKGTLNLQQVSSLIEFTQARYAINEGTININNKTIDLGQLTLRDTINNTANLTGKLNHDFFTKINLNLKLDTDRFLILNTTAEDNALFYGHLLLGATVGITGPLELPLVNVVAKTLPGSELTLSPFAEGAVGLEEDYIIFGNPETYVKPEEGVDIYNAQAAIPADITLNLDVSSDALLRIIVDPVTGDRLKCQGSSNMLMRFMPSGLMEMYGTYTIDSGQYGFSYSDVVRRNFEIVKGGTVFFNGDPLNARFNLAAQYSTKASTYELIASEATLSTGEIKQAQKKQAVNVLLNLNGNLAAPELAFDINLPDLEDDAANSAVPRKLEDLRNNTNELNKQVFGLLLVNSFIVSSSATDFGDIGQNVVLSSVSKLFSNQLNSLAEKFIKGVEINFDLSSYKSQYANDGSGGTVTELGVGVTKQLFNDRVSFTAGGSVEVGDESTASQIAGDFLLTYELTASGKYLLKVFRRSDYDVLNEDNGMKTGVGISFRKSFDDRIKQKEKIEKEQKKSVKE